MNISRKRLHYIYKIVDFLYKHKDRNVPILVSSYHEIEFKDDCYSFSSQNSYSGITRRGLDKLNQSQIMRLLDMYKDFVMDFKSVAVFSYHW